MATAIDYAGAWKRLNEALARNVDQAGGAAEFGKNRTQSRLC